VQPGSNWAKPRRRLHVVPAGSSACVLGRVGVWGLGVSEVARGGGLITSGGCVRLTVCVRHLALFGKTARQEGPLSRCISVVSGVNRCPPDGGGGPNEVIDAGSPKKHFWDSRMHEYGGLKT